MTFITYGQTRDKGQSISAQRPLAEILNPDGTLKVGPGVRGSFDPKGCRMAAGPGGEPTFSPVGPDRQAGGEEVIAAAGDENWYPFDQPWTMLNGPVYAIAVDGTDVYVGGDFTWAGKRDLLNLAAEFLVRI